MAAAPVAATAAATACKAAGLTADVLLGLGGTPTKAGVADAEPGASPATATACALAAGPVSAVVFLRFPDMT